MTGPNLYQRHAQIDVRIKHKWLMPSDLVRCMTSIQRTVSNAKERYPNNTNAQMSYCRSHLPISDEVVFMRVYGLQDNKP